MKVQNLALIVTILTPGVVFASELSESHLEAAEQLLKVTRVAQLTDSAIDTMLKVQLDANPALADFEEVMREFLARHIGWEAVRADVVQMYAESFTEAELRTLIEFNKTPVGQKAVRLMPELMAKGARLGQQRVQENMAELQELILQRQNELDGN